MELNFLRIKFQHKTEFEFQISSQSRFNQQLTISSVEKLSFRIKFNAQLSMKIPSIYHLYILNCNNKLHVLTTKKTSLFLKSRCKFFVVVRVNCFSLYICLSYISYFPFRFSFLSIFPLFLFLNWVKENQINRPQWEEKHAIKKICVCNNC